MAKRNSSSGRSFSKSKLMMAVAIAAAVGVGGFARTAVAGLLYWDPSGGVATPSGGGGTWNTGSNPWSNLTADTTWTDNSGSMVTTAIFGGAAGGTVNLAATDTYANGVQFNTSGYVITGNTLTLGGTTPTITGYANATISSVLDGTGGVTIAGTSTLTLNSSTAETITGGVALSSGTLLLDFSNMGGSPNNMLASSNTLSLGGVLSIRANASGTTNQTFNGLTLTPGASAIVINNNVTGATSLTLGAITRTTAGSTIDFSSNGVITTTNTNTAGILGGWATYGGTTWAYNTNPGGTNIIGGLTNGSYYTTTTGGNTGTNYTSSENVDVTSSLSGLTTAITINSLRFNGTTSGAWSITLDSGTANVISFGGILVTSNVGANAVSVVANSATLTSGNGSDLIVIQNNTSSSLTIGTAIVNNGATAIGLTKSGAGTLVLSGTEATASTFTGNINIDGGTLFLSGNGVATANALGNTTVTRTATINNGGALSFGANQTLASINSASSLTLSTAINAGGTMTNAGAFYNPVGPIILNGGVLTDLGSGNAAAQAWEFYGPPATAVVTVGGTTPSTITGIGSNAGIALNGYAAATNTFNIGSTGSSQPDLTVSVPIVNPDYTGNPSGGITKTGTGTLALAGANTYTGVTLVSAGTLLLQNVAALQGSTLDTSGAGTLSFGTLAQEAFGGLKATGGAGTLNLQNANSAGVAGIIGNGNAPTANTTFSGALAGPTGSTLVVALDGESLTLTGTSTNFFGNVIVTGGNSGTLVLGSTTALNGNNPVSFANEYSDMVLTSNATIGGLNGGGINGSSFSSQFINGGTNTLTLAPATGTVDNYQGTTSGTAMVVVLNGAGTQILTTAQSWTGGTVITSGTLVWGITNAVPSGPTSYGLTINGTGNAAIDSNSPITTSNFTQAWSGNFTFNGDSSLNLGTGAVTLMVSPTLTLNAGSLTVAGIIGGAHGLTEAGAGTLILSGSSTYSGGTTINGGVFDYNLGTDIGTASPLGAAAGLPTTNITFGGGTLEFGTAPALALNANRSMVISSGGGTIDVRNSNAISFGGAISGAGALTITNSSTSVGTLVLTGTSGVATYSGATTINSDAMLLLNFSTSTATATNLINNSANNSGLVLGGGYLSVTGKATTVNSQQFNGLTLNAGGSGIVLTLNSATSLVLSLGAITRSIAGSEVDFTDPTGTQSSNNGVTTSTVNNSAGILGGWATVAGSDWATNSGGNIIALPSGSYTSLTASSAGTSNTNYNLLTATGSLASINGSQSVNSLNISDSAAAHSLALGANNFTVSQASVGSGVGPTGGLIYSGGQGGANGYTISGSGTIGAGAANEFIVYVKNSGAVLTISAPIIGAGAGSLTKVGTGSLVLSGTNLFTGGITIDGSDISGVTGGFLVVGSAGALNGNAVSIPGAGTLVLNGFSTSVGGLSSGTEAAVIDNNATAATLTINSTTNSTYNGTLTNGTGTLTLAKGGSGTETLTGNNNGYTGGTTINAGVLRAAGGSLTLGNSTNVVAMDGGTLQLVGGLPFANNTTVTANSSITVDDAVSGGGGSIDTLGTLAIGNQTLTVSGGANVSSGTANLVFGTVTLSGNATFNVTNPTNGGTTLLTLPTVVGAYNITFSGSGNVSQTGVWSNGSGVTTASGFSGTLTLSQVNTFTGGLTIGGGTVFLSLNTGGASPPDLASGTVVTFTGAGTLTLNSNNLTIPGLSGSSSTSVIQNNNVYNPHAASGGGGILTLAPTGASSTYAGILQDGAIGSLTLAVGAASSSGLQILSGSNSSFTGPVSILGGGLEVSSLANVGVNSSIGAAAGNNSAIILGSTSGQNAMLAYNGTGSSTNRYFNLGNGVGNLFTIEADGSGALVLNGGFFATANVASTLVLQGTSTAANAVSAPIPNMGTSALSITKTGAGTWDITGANTYTGITAVNGGTLILDNSNLATATNLVNGASGLALGGGTLNIKQQSGVTTSQTFASTTVNLGASAIVGTNAGANNLNVIIGAITRNVGGTVDFTLPTGSITTTTANVNPTNGQQTILGGYATVAGTSWAVSGTSGTNPVTALATYTPSFTTGKDVDAPTGTSTPGAMTINSLRFNNSGSYAVNTSGNIVVAAGGILETSGVGANSVAITGNTITSGQTELVINQNNTAGSMTISSIIGTEVTKTGAGTLVYSGSSAIANTFVTGGTLNINGSGGVSGTVTLLGGSLTLGSGAGNLTFSTLTLGNGGTVASVLDLGGHNLVVSNTLNLGGVGANNSSQAVINSTIAVGTITLPATVNYNSANLDPLAAAINANLLLAGATNITVNHAYNPANTGGYDLDINGAITGNSVLSLTQTTGITRFSGVTANASTSTISQTGGTLILNKSGPFNVNAIGAGGITLGTGGAISYTGTSTDEINDAATVTYNGAGVMALNGHSDTIGALVAGSNTAFSLTLGSGILTIGNALGDANSTILGVVSGTGGIIKGGPAGGTFATTANTLTLNAANTYTGVTGVNSGTLLLSTTGSISSASNLAVGDGIFTIAASYPASQSFNGTAINVGSSVINAAGSFGSSAYALNLGAITRSTGGTVDFGSLPTTGNFTTSSANANFAGGAQTIIGGWATVGNGANWAVSAGNGTTAGNISALGIYNTSATFAAGANMNAPSGATTATAGLTINSLRYGTGGSAPTTTLAGSLTVATGGVLDAAAWGAYNVTITGGSITSGNGQDLDVIIANSANTVTIASQITGSGIGLTYSTVGLNIAGPLILTNTNNTYTGPTAINAPTNGSGTATTLTLSAASTNNIASSSSINIGGGTVLSVTGLTSSTIVLGAAQTLTGFGSVTGSVTTVSGTKVTPGSSGAVGTLTIGTNFTTVSGTILNFYFAPTSNTTQVNNGLLVVSGTTGLASGTGVNLYNLGGSNPLTTAGTYKLIGYTGTAPTATNLSVLNSQPGYNYSFADVSGFVDLTVTPPVIWSGHASATWDTASYNWTTTGNVPTTFSNSNNGVILGDTYNVGAGNVPVSNTNISVASGGVTPAGVSFTNNVVNYTVSSSGATGIAGSTGITMSGMATVTLQSANTYTGATNVSDGTLIVGDATHPGASIGGSGVTVGGGGTLGGHGTINAAVSVNPGGSLTPGGSIGTLTTAMGLGLSTATNATPSNLNYTLGTAGSGIPSSGMGSLIAVTGGILALPTQGGSLNLNLTDNAGANSQGSMGNGTYELFSYVTLSGGTGGSDETSLFNFSSPLSNRIYTVTNDAAASQIDLTIAPSTTSTTYTLSASPGSLNLLKNGTLSGSSTITNTGGAGTDTLDFANLTGTSGNTGVATVSGNLASGGPLANGGGYAVQTLSIFGVDYGSTSVAAASDPATNATIGGNATFNGTAGAISVNVGDAQAAYSDVDGTPTATQLAQQKTADNSSLFAGSTALTAAVSNTGSYAGLASRSFTVQNGGAILQTEATILAGSNSSGGTNTVTMQWRDRSSIETAVNPGHPPLPAGLNQLDSDVVLLTGMNDSTGNHVTNGAITTNETDIFTLQMTYGANYGTVGAANPAEKLVWLDPADSTWELAKTGDITSNGSFAGGAADGPNAGEYVNTSWNTFIGEYPTLSDDLGAYGNYVGNGSNGGAAGVNYVWAVVDHDGQFAVIPEPTSLGLLGLGALGLLARRRKGK